MISGSKWNVSESDLKNSLNINFQTTWKAEVRNMLENLKEKAGELKSKEYARESISVILAMLLRLDILIFLILLNEVDNIEKFFSDTTWNLFQGEGSNSRNDLVVWLVYSDSTWRAARAFIGRTSQWVKNSGTTYLWSWKFWQKCQFLGFNVDFLATGW